jgi:dihydrolipoamide dehydrogenase
MRKVKAVIIGAGSAGLSALRVIRKKTSDYLLIDQGPLGTTCARYGCMPSKVLIQAAADFARRRTFADKGIRHAEQLTCDIPALLDHVRRQRDFFTQGMMDATRKLAGDERLVIGTARFTSPGTITVNGRDIQGETFIIATGSQPRVPDAWTPFRHRILTSRTLFEQQNLPGRIGIVGLGAIGLELGQALHKLGIEVFGFDARHYLGGLSDPAVNEFLSKRIQTDFPLYLGTPAQLRESGDTLIVGSGDHEVRVDKIVAALGVTPALDALGLDAFIETDDHGNLPFDSHSARVKGHPIYLAGDVNGCRPILHEALDEGLFAGVNTTHDEDASFCRRTPLHITFSDPELAVVGRSFRELSDQDFVTGRADFSDQARARIAAENKGLLRLYVAPHSGQLLGAEMAIPGAEHIGHLLALACQQQMTVFDLLKMPFYHPTLEEGLRTALRDTIPKLSVAIRQQELPLCSSRPEPPLC